MYDFTRDWFKKNDNKLFEMEAEELEKKFLKDIKFLKQLGIGTAVITPIAILFFNLLYEHNLKKSRNEAARRRRERQKLYSSSSINEEKKYRTAQNVMGSISAGAALGGVAGGATILDSSYGTYISSRDFYKKAQEIIKKEGVKMTPLEESAFEKEFYKQLYFAEAFNGSKYGERLESFKFKESMKFMLPFAAVSIIMAMIAGWAKEKADNIKKERKQNKK